MITIHINPVTLGEVVNEIRCLRGDCSTGPDHIPAKIIKIVAKYLGSPLTDIINTCIADRCFLSAWKIARICAIPKVNQVTSENNLRPCYANSLTKTTCSVVPSEHTEKVNQP